VERGVQPGDAAAELGVLGRHAAALANQQYRRQHRRAGNANEKSELHHLHRAEGEGQAGLVPRSNAGDVLCQRRGGKRDGGEREAGKPGQEAAPKASAA
jgi:hypothetical protein